MRLRAKEIVVPVIHVLPTSFTVRNIERSLKFYQGAFGFVISDHHPTGFHIDNPHPPMEGPEREAWDAYQEVVCGIKGAVLRQLIYLIAPDGETMVELLEYEAPAGQEALPRIREFNEPAKAIVVLEVTDSAELVERIRDLGGTVIAPPQAYKNSLCTYILDLDGNAICMFEGTSPAGG
jgi:predicted enzyme related to lactoylglutathione lyase